MIKAIISLALAFLTIGLGQTSYDRILERWGGSSGFSPLYIDSTNAYLRAEYAYRTADYLLADQILNRFWRLHPMGSEEWQTGIDEAQRLALSKGANFGSPACYSALRMLTDCMTWRIHASKQTPVSPHPIVMTIVLIGRSSGIEPTSIEELVSKGGHKNQHTLAAEFDSDDNNQLIDQSLYLFKEYVSAMTDGQLRIDQKIIHLRELDVPVEVTERPVQGQVLRFAGLANGAMVRIWHSIDDVTRNTTDWWFVLYPSNVPEQYPDFRRTAFITGGMDVGPDRRSPAFVVDDRWLLRVPPHLGHGIMTEGERRAYLPAWMMHEFFHHLYRTYPEFRLEETDHQWFDRSKWPPDFNGRIVADYYSESLHKRLQSASVPLQVALRYSRPPKSLFTKITPAMVIGTYVREPQKNDWHQGVISWDQIQSTDSGPSLRWTNAAGRSWLLALDSTNGLLRFGSGTPYREQARQEFRIALRRQNDGTYVAEVAGYFFDGDFYRKLPDVQ